MIEFYSSSRANQETDGLNFCLNRLVSWNEDSEECDLDMKVVVCARYDIKMSAGKLGAQVGHSIHSLCRDSEEDVLEEWESEDSNSKIVVLGVRDENELNSIIDRAEELEIGAFPIEDAGRTEVDPGTVTVAAIGPCYSALIDVITGNLRPYKDPGNFSTLSQVPSAGPVIVSPGPVQ